MALYQIVMDGTNPRCPGVTVVKNTQTNESFAEPMPGEVTKAWTDYQAWLAAGNTPDPVPPG